MKTMLEAVDKVIAERISKTRNGDIHRITQFEWVSFSLKKSVNWHKATNDAFMGQIKSNQTDKIVHEAIKLPAVAVAIIEHLSKEYYEQRNNVRQSHTRAGGQGNSKFRLQRDRFRNRKQRRESQTTRWQL